MNSAFYAVLLIVGFAIFANANEDNDNWPCYLKKCGKNDPNLKTCLLHHANRALESIFVGDNKIGIPNFVPFEIGKLELGKNRTFKLHMEKAKVIGINNIHVEDIDWNLKEKKLDIKFLYNSAIYIDGDYKSSGSFLDRSIEGKGHVDLIFVGGSQGGNLSYSMNYDLIKVQGKEYIQIKNRVCDRSEGFRMEFTNQMVSKERAEEDRKFLNKNADKANAALSDEIKDIICELVDCALNPIFFNFPISIIFDTS